MPKKRLPLGMTVIDSEAGYNRQIVMSHPSKTSENYVVEGTGETIADLNEKYGYDPESPVIQTISKNLLNENIDNWARKDIDEIKEMALSLDLQMYTYPAPRLKSGFAYIPNKVETNRDLFCHQYARLMHLSSSISKSNRYMGWLYWTKYDELVNDDISMSSIVMENKYQLNEDFGRCVYCNRQKKTTFDHVIPVSENGANTVDNMVPSCQSCNSSKGNKNVIDWHQEHALSIDRLVLGKYIKQKLKEFEEENTLDDEMPEWRRERWEGLEIVRIIEQRLWADSER